MAAMLSLGCLVGLLAWDARVAGQFIAFAQTCDTDGDGVDDGVVLNGVCMPGGGGGDHGQHRPPPGPRNGTFTESTFTPPCGHNSPDDGDAECMASRSCPNWPRDRAYWRWQRQVTYVNGLVTNTGPWSRIDTVCRHTGPNRAPTAAEVRESVVLKLPKAEPEIAPPGGRTLVNFDTIFYTRINVFVTDVQVVGQQVRVRAEPASFQWHFGDGGSLSTDKQGGPYPNMDIVHRYAMTEDVDVDVDVSYRAQYRVGNAGPWQDIPGLITITNGPGVPLAVVQTSAVLKRR